jgi:hypothetical protein
VKRAMTKRVRGRKSKWGDVPVQWPPAHPDEFGGGLDRHGLACRGPMMGKFAIPSYICQIVHKESASTSSPDSWGRFVDHHLAIRSGEFGMWGTLGEMDCLNRDDMETMSDAGH